MKKVIVMMIIASLLLGACLPGFLRPEPTATASPLPISVAELEGTATALSMEAVQPLASPTLEAVNTPVSPTETNTSAPTDTPIPTATENPALLALTATLSTVVADMTSTPGITSTQTALSTPTLGTPGPLHYGTMPPNLPYGDITLLNQAKAQVYISLRCVTKDGYVTIIEYPVAKMVKTTAPAGNYTYVVWVGGRQIVGDFALGKSQSLTIKIFKDKVIIK